VVAVCAAGGARIDERVIPKTDRRLLALGTPVRAEAADHAGRPETRFDGRQMASTASGSAAERAGRREAKLWTSPARGYGLAWKEALPLDWTAARREMPRVILELP
jgi:hypothetical protein